MKTIWKPRLFAVFAALATLFAGSAAAADGVTLLKAFVDRTARAQGRFEQTVYGQNSPRGEHSKGSFAFERPGKFRWTYEAPFPQVLVSDGVRLWSYDPELAQVTTKQIGDALGATPAAILAGDGELETNFTLADGGSMNGMQWAVATPKEDGTFARMRLGFDGTRLVGMEIEDNFGQRTLLRFTAFDADAAIAPDTFTFEPPPGADVVGE